MSIGVEEHGAHEGELEEGVKAHLGRLPSMVQAVSAEPTLMSSALLLRDYFARPACTFSDTAAGTGSNRTGVMAYEARPRERLRIVLA